ncbi:MAG: Calx-beta domain-containing protein [Pseudomonadota bacterium]
MAACGGGGGDDGGGSSPPPPPPPPPPAGGLPALTISAAAMPEGNAGSSDLAFNVTLSAVDAADVTVDYATADGSATESSDYTPSNGTLRIAAGDTQATVFVPVTGEACFEDDESLTVTLSNVSANASIATATATGTIENDDAQPVVSIADSELPEGDAGVSSMPFTVSLDRVSCDDISGNFTSNAVTADGADFTIATNPFVLPAGSLATSVDVEIVGDTFYETDETLSVNLEDPSANVAPGDTEAFGTIRTDDLPPLSISAVDELEGDSGPRIFTFQLGLAGITNELTVDYATADGSATVADNDYVAQSGTLTIPAGELLTDVRIEVIGDTDAEATEQFRVELSNLIGDAVLPAGLDFSLGTIIDDDTPVTVEPTATPSNASVVEGDSGTQTMTFRVVLNTPVTNDVVIDYATADVTAIAGEDYTAASGRLRIAAGDTQGQIAVDVSGDTDEEASEYFHMNLTQIAGDANLFAPRVTGTILDDDRVGPSIVEIRPASIFEGDSGTRELQIAVTANPAPAATLTVDYESRDVTALAGSDYDAASGTLTFAAGETVQFITVPVYGDTFIEADEAFDVELSNLTGSGSLVNLPAFVYAGLIESDDPFAMVSVDNVAMLEGDSGATDMTFTVSIDAAAADPVTMDYVSADATGSNIATPGDDYTAVSGSLTIPAGDTAASIVVSVAGDTENEFDEPFNIELSNVSQNAEFDTAIGTGRIVNDDGSPGWGLPQALDQGGQDNLFAKLAVNADGAATAVWASVDFTGSFETNRYDPALGWGFYETLVDNFSSQYFDVFVDGDGETTLAWSITRAMFARHTPAGGWTPGVEFEPSGAGGQDKVNLAGNEGGDVAAFWRKRFTATPNIREATHSRYDPATGAWGTTGGTTTEALSQARLIDYPHIDMNASGDAVAVWSDVSTRASYYDASAGNWSVPEVLTNELFPGFNDAGYEPKVAIHDSGNAIAVWDNFLGTGVSGVGDVWASVYDAASATWGEAIELEASNLDATSPQIEMDAAGNAYVVWMQDNNPLDPWNDTFEIWARRYDVATATWEPAVLVHDSDTRVSQFGFFGLPVVIPLDLPALAVDANGSAMLAWSERVNGEFFIRSSRYDISEPTPSWTPPEIVSGDAYPFAIFPDIVIDGSGNAIVVWQAGDGELFEDTNIAEIWTNRYTPP